MKLEHLHIHLEANNCEFQNLAEGFRHCVYKNLDTNLKVSIPRNKEILPEVVAMICNWLDIPVPNEIMAILKKEIK